MGGGPGGRAGWYAGRRTSGRVPGGRGGYHAFTGTPREPVRAARAGSITPLRLPSSSAGGLRYRLCCRIASRAKSADFGRPCDGGGGRRTLLRRDVPLRTGAWILLGGEAGAWGGGGGQKGMVGARRRGIASPCMALALPTPGGAPPAPGDPAAAPRRG